MLGGAVGLETGVDTLCFTDCFTARSFVARDAEDAEVHREALQTFAPLLLCG